MVTKTLLLSRDMRDDPTQAVGEQQFIGKVFFGGQFLQQRKDLHAAIARIVRHHWRIPVIAVKQNQGNERAISLEIVLTGILKNLLQRRAGSACNSDSAIFWETCGPNSHPRKKTTRQIPLAQWIVNRSQIHILQHHVVPT